MGWTRGVDQALSPCKRSGGVCTRRITEKKGTGREVQLPDMTPYVFLPTLKFRVR